MILAGSKVNEGCASVLVIGLGEKSSSHKYKKLAGCPIEMSLDHEWTEFCDFTKNFVKVTQFICLVVGIILLIHSFMQLDHLDKENSWFTLFETIELTLCLSVACIPTGYVKVRHDLWSRYCFKLSELYKCSFNKFYTFNKLAAIDKMMIPIEDLFFKDLSKFRFVSLTGSCQQEFKDKSGKLRVTDFIKGNRAKELVENITTMVYCSCKRNCPEKAMETFLHYNVFGSLDKTNLLVQTRIKF